MKKIKRYTVVAQCTCGCDETEIYHTRAISGHAAADKIKQQAADPGPNLPAGSRELDVIAVFRGQKRNQI